MNTVDSLKKATVRQAVNSWFTHTNWSKSLTMRVPERDIDGTVNVVPVPLGLLHTALSNFIQKEFDPVLVDLNRIGGKQIHMVEIVGEVTNQPRIINASEPTYNVKIVSPETGYGVTVIFREQHETLHTLLTCGENKMVRVIGYIGQQDDLGSIIGQEITLLPKKKVKAEYEYWKIQCYFVWNVMTELEKEKEKKKGDTPISHSMRRYQPYSPNTYDPLISDSMHSQENTNNMANTNTYNWNTNVRVSHFDPVQQYSPQKYDPLISHSIHYEEKNSNNMRHQNTNNSISVNRGTKRRLADITSGDDIVCVSPPKKQRVEIINLQKSLLQCVLIKLLHIPQAIVHCISLMGEGHIVECQDCSQEAHMSDSQWEKFTQEDQYKEWRLLNVYRGQYDAVCQKCYYNNWCVQCEQYDADETFKCPECEMVYCIDCHRDIQKWRYGEHSMCLVNEHALWTD